MPNLHLVQGGSDKAWLERAAHENRRSRSWVVPRSIVPGDKVVIYVRGYGFFATGRSYSLPRPRPDWKNRYGAGIESIRLIERPISLSTIRRHIPDLKWANYPRSIATPSAELADQIRRLVRERRTTGVPDLDDEALESANIEELRRVALLSSRKFVTPTEQRKLHRARSTAIKLYVLARANGKCEGCGSDAPFRTVDGKPFLEAHHVERLADDGPDHPRKVIGLCPNCHRRAHLSHDSGPFKKLLLNRLSKLERGGTR